MSGLPFIVLGDSTTGGGKVIEGSPYSTINGKPIARVGDKVTCPAHKGVFPIMTGDATCLIDDKPAARHNDSVACGCKLIGSQTLATTGGTSRGDSSSSSQASAGGTAAAAAAEAAKAFDMHFLIKGEKTGKPMANVGYKLTLEDGSEIVGRTDKNGLTKKISSNQPAIATITAPFHDDKNSTDCTDTDDGCDPCCSDHS